MRSIVLQHLAISLVLLLVNSFKQYGISSININKSRIRVHHLHAEKDNNKDKNDKKNTKFDRVVDDFLGKRYGAGEAFYGKRTSSLSEDEYQAMRGDVPVNKEKELLNREFKDNAVLIVHGITGSSAPGQWIAFELAEKGFNVRVVCDNLKKAVEVFGYDNVDLIQLGADSTERDYAKAIQGTQAMIICSNFEPAADLGPFNLLPLPGGGGLKKCEEETIVAQKLLDVSSRARKGGIGQVKKVVYLSRVISTDKKKAGSVLQGLWDSSAENQIFNDFRSLHVELESSVRKAGIEYVIVRAPSRVLQIREGAVYDLVIFGASPKDKQSSKSVLESFGDKELQIGVLDLAESCTQALLQDFDGITFTVCEQPSDIKEEDSALVDITGYEGKNVQSRIRKQAQGNRVSRLWYYGILNVDDDGLRVSYMMKPSEAYKSQLEEDIKVEEYWDKKLKLISRDF